ncbi:CGNR zinc finger domain-containing protein [Mesoterricola silvestris]|uniref:Zinc finger CGNR domain-containing protein n=1 Tax=Mesoterricola silvestris TaxID=2927979 RepID=A0AA48GFD2_9BACT|nr:ABATE domain-containing protein [Mesoterricola silvestris]BDU71591.1 hypothetical protein METEAL_07650 [Mesoterricola silvestris]
MDAPAATPFPGEISLDFANTWADRGRASTDELRSMDAFLAFARRAGLVDEAEGAGLDRLAREDPAAAGAALARARRAREAIYGLCSRRAAGVPPRPGDLRAFNGALAGALGHLRLEAQGHGFRWAWDRNALDAPLWPILRAAADLLASEEAGRIRECAGDGCTWLFLDRSRAGSRRWCSMSSCGNRAKARRHYRAREFSRPR